MSTRTQNRTENAWRRPSVLVPTREQHTRLATNVWIDILIKFNNNIRVCVCVLPLLIHMQISTQRMVCQSKRGRQRKFFPCRTSSCSTLSVSTKCLDLPCARRSAVVHLSQFNGARSITLWNWTAKPSRYIVDQGIVNTCAHSSLQHTVTHCNTQHI